MATRFAVARQGGIRSCGNTKMGDRDMAEKLELHVPEKRDESFCIRSRRNNYSMILIRRLGCIRYKVIEKASAFLGLKQW